MDEVQPPNLTIDLTDESMQKEVELKLTVGQLKLISEFLSHNIQPKGFQMIEFAYDLFKRLNAALESIESEETTPEVSGDED